MSLLNLLEQFVMFEKIRKMKNKKGFTLVELIVVLVILAILAALLIPALTGYIDKANEEKATAECRMVVMAAQTVGTTYYAENDALANADGKKPTPADINAYSELGDGAKYKVTYDAAGKVKSVVYTSGVYTCTYTAATTDATAATYKCDKVTTKVDGQTVTVDAT